MKMESTLQKTWIDETGCPFKAKNGINYIDALTDLRTRVSNVLKNKEKPPCFFAYTAENLWEKLDIWKLATAFRWWDEWVTQYLNNLDTTQRVQLKEYSLVWIYAVFGYLIGINWKEIIKPWIQALLDWTASNRIIIGDTYRQLSWTDELWQKIPSLSLGELDEELFLLVNRCFWRLPIWNAWIKQIIIGGINTALNEFGMLMMATTRSYGDDFGYTHKDEILTTLRNSLPLLKKQSTLPMEATIRQPHLTWRIREWDTMVLEEEAERKMHALLLTRWTQDPTELYRLWCPIWYSNLPVFTELFEMLIEHVEGNFGKK